MLSGKNRHIFVSSRVYMMIFGAGGQAELLRNLRLHFLSGT